MLQKEKSLQLFERARKYMPGPHSNLRAPARIQPLFIERGDGAKLWDVDGNEYIDYVCTYGPGILGHGNAEYIQALQQQLETLYYLSTGDFRTPIEVDLAEKFVRHIPCADQVRFCLAGTETVQLAIRMARAYTGRPRFIRFEGHYHGWMDNVLGGAVDENPAGRPFALRPARDPMGSEGAYAGATDESFKLKWNDDDVLEQVLERYGDEVAMVLMEPILLNFGCCMPRPHYLERVRELCDHYGVVLCLDEVQTGFRVGLNGAQGLLGVTPDIATFAKAFGGGIPLGAVAGRREIMELLYDRRVLGAGTFNGYPFGIAAALATFTILERDDGAIFRHIDRMQRRLMDGLKAITRKKGLPALIQGPTGVFVFLTVDTDEAYTADDLKDVNWKTQSRFEKAMAEEGILLVRGGRWFLSGALTEKDVDQTLVCAERVIEAL
jgi:glutamate-1-semialdehyde 2,1-aminomutase